MERVLVKKYKNRKLYYTKEGWNCYISLDKLLEEVISGVNIKVVDNETGQEITANTIQQALHQKQKNLLKIKTSSPNFAEQAAYYYMHLIRENNQLQEIIA